MNLSLKIAFCLFSACLILTEKVNADNYLGAKGGLNYSTSSCSYTGYEQRHNAGGFYIYELSYKKGTAIQLDFLYSQKGSKGGELFTRQEMGETSIRSGWYSHREYLELSGIFKKSISKTSLFNLNMTAGISTGYLISAEERYFSYYQGTFLNFDSVEIHNKLDFGLLTGADFEIIINNYLLQVEAHYYIGIADIYESGDDFARNRCLSLSLGWGFKF